MNGNLHDDAYEIGQVTNKNAGRFHMISFSGARWFDAESTAIRFNRTQTLAIIYAQYTSQKIFPLL